jgi:hypothetical protein
MKKRYLSLAGLVFIMSGCASMGQPDQASLAKLPVVDFGETVPADGNYVLHFPAGVGIETPVIFQGDLFEQAAQEQVTVKLAQDIYVHKQWMSYDGEHWVDARSALDLQVKVVLPGYAHPEPGHVILEMNKKP